MGYIEVYINDMARNEKSRIFNRDQTPSDLIRMYYSWKLSFAIQLNSKWNSVRQSNDYFAWIIQTIVDIDLRFMLFHYLQSFLYLLFCVRLLLFFSFSDPTCFRSDTHKIWYNLSVLIAKIDRIVINAFICIVLQSPEWLLISIGILIDLWLGLGK